MSVLSASSDIHVVELAAAFGRMLDWEGENDLGHAWRVALLAKRLAEARGDDDLARHVFLAGFLCDAGALSFSRHIIYELLEHPAILTQKIDIPLFFHPLGGSSWLARQPGLTRIARLVAQHHECQNGSGYPYGLQGAAIDPGAQILHLADQVDLVLRGEAPSNTHELLLSLQPFADEVFEQSLLTELAAILESTLPLALLTQPARLKNEVQHEINALAEWRLVATDEDWDGVFTGLGELIETRNGLFLRGHAARVAEMAEVLGLALALPQNTRRDIRRAAALQNLGEVLYRGGLDTKHSRLEPAEKALIHAHPELGYTLLAGLRGLSEVALIVRHHHENWDGSGYPSKLAQEEIPLGARLLHVLDACVAMSSERPYQRRRDWKRIVGELRRQAGKHFDPKLVTLVIEHFAN